MKEYNCTDVEAINDLPFPCLYGEVKWALKFIRGEFPPKTDILRCYSTDEQVAEFNAEWHRSMADYR